MCGLIARPGSLGWVLSYRVKIDKRNGNKGFSILE